VTVLVFTNGFGLSLLGVPAEVPILSLLAPVIFAILFGLSNDYEVYLVTRTREELDAGASPSEAVAQGVGRGAHIVIAAAMIMIFVFASYIFQPGTSVIQFGFAMTVAILLDAAIARMLLLPALMHLGGGRMWWPGRKPPGSGTYI
jgi:RND superfamily putative drug exporter